MMYSYMIVFVKTILKRLIQSFRAKRDVNPLTLGMIMVVFLDFLNSFIVCTKATITLDSSEPEMASFMRKSIKFMFLINLNSLGSRNA